MPAPQPLMPCLKQPTRSRTGSTKAPTMRGILVGQLDEILPGKETFTRAQSSLADLLERQPLVLGAIGLAVGAAVAGAFRASDLENEWVGEYSDGVREDLSKRAGAVSESVREVADTLKNEVKDAGTEAIRPGETGRRGRRGSRGTKSEGSHDRRKLRLEALRRRNTNSID